jgi:hypothetical protein
MLFSRVILIQLILTVATSCGAADPPETAIAPTATTQTGQKELFYKNLPANLATPRNDVERLLLREYGAIFLARGGATPPGQIVFADEAAVRAFQSGLPQSSEKFGSVTVTLQSAAMKALKEARAEAQAARLSIGPRAADSSRRSYAHTVDLWASRVNPGFAHWVRQGKVTKAEADRIKKLPAFDQVAEILKLEQRKIFFAESLDKSIIYSVAPPGTSQHLSMLALDVKEYENARVREILARHGWFQTVTSDLPHFTYLGVTEAELPGLGLRKVENSGRVFWVPDI